MTKRFTKYVPDSYGYTFITTIIDNEKNKQTGNTDEIVDMLNELAEENKQLKSYTGEMEDYLARLEEKNEQLQTKNNAYLQDIEVYKEDNTHLKLENDELKKILKFLRNDNATDILNVLNSQENQIWELKKENEQLKSTIKEVTELLSEEVDLFSDKATEHDINAYVELKELDNKDAFYMATATKKAIKMLKEL